MEDSKVYGWSLHGWAHAVVESYEKFFRKGGKADLSRVSLKPKKRQTGCS